MDRSDRQTNLPGLDTGDRQLQAIDSWVGSVIESDINAAGMSPDLPDRVFAATVAELRSSSSSNRFRLVSRRREWRGMLAMAASLAVVATVGWFSMAHHSGGIGSDSVASNDNAGGAVAPDGGGAEIEHVNETSPALAGYEFVLASDVDYVEDRLAADREQIDWLLAAQTLESDDIRAELGALFDDAGGTSAF